MDDNPFPDPQQNSIPQDFPKAIFPPWEDQAQPLWDRWWATTKAVFTAPTEFFTRMRPEGGLGAPLAYGVIGASIGAIIAQIFSMVFNLGILGLGSMAAKHNSEAMGVQAAGSVIGGICSIFFIPIIVAVGLFIGSGITHLLLMLVGGAQKGYETTFRVNSYVNGALGLLAAIPICGGMVYPIWGIVLQIIGLSKAHDIPTTKAALAVLLPIALLCTCAAIAIFLIFGASVFAVAASRHQMP